MLPNDVEYNSSDRLRLLRWSFQLYRLHLRLWLRREIPYCSPEHTDFVTHNPNRADKSSDPYRKLRSSENPIGVETVRSGIQENGRWRWAPVTMFGEGWNWGYKIGFILNILNCLNWVRKNILNIHILSFLTQKYIFIFINNNNYYLIDNINLLIRIHGFIG